MAVAARWRRPHTSANLAQWHRQAGLAREVALTVAFTLARRSVRQDVNFGAGEAEVEACPHTERRLQVTRLRGIWVEA